MIGDQKADVAYWCLLEDVLTIAKDEADLCETESRNQSVRWKRAFLDPAISSSGTHDNMIASC
jgi:hypothetical protein